MERKNKTSNNQLKALIVSIIIGVGILSMPSSVAETMENGGWLSIILGGALSIPFIIIMNKLTRIYPGKTYFEFGKEIVPPFIFNIISIVFLIYYIITSAFTVRIFGEVIKAFLLETTPTEIIIIAMLLVTSYIGRCEIEVIARMAMIVYPIIILTTIGVVLFSIPGIDFTNLLPILPRTSISFKAVLKGTLITFFSYMGYEIILVAMGNVEKPDESLKYSMSAIIHVIVIYLLLFFITLSQFGIHELKRQIWPSLVLVREIGFPGFFVENLDGIVMAVWVMVVFATLGPFMYSSGIVLSSIFSTKEHDYFVTSMIPIIYALSLIPQNLRDVYRYMDISINVIGLISVVIFPTILFIIAKVKKGREKA